MTLGHNFPEEDFRLMNPFFFMVLSDIKLFEIQNL